MNNNAGIILEGGAMRSVFSAGILDFFLEKNIEIPNVLAVSAGAYAGMNYVSGQKGRLIDAVLMPLKEQKYMGFGTFLRKGTFFDMDLLFDEIPNKRVPFDFESFQNSSKRFIINTVDCNTGNTIFHDHFEDKQDFLKICRAGNSLPYIAKVIDYHGVPMLDGGTGDALPIGKALEEGWNKIIMVFTRDGNYRKKKRNIYLAGLHLFYHKHPEFVKMMEKRHEKYNESIDIIEQLEKEGKVFIFRPTKLIIENNESNVDTLLAYYQHGYETAKEKFEEFKKFLFS